jgi:hypothetical protein
MKNFVLLLITVVPMMSCVSTGNEPLVSRFWEPQGEKTYVFETNNPNNTGLVSYKGWSGFRRDAQSLSLEYTIQSGGQGLLVGMKIELSSKEVLPFLVVDSKDRYNFLDPLTLEERNETWEKFDTHEKGDPISLNARKEKGNWLFYINGKLAGAFPADSSEARYGAILITTYGHERPGASTDFPKKKIFVTMRILEER